MLHDHVLTAEAATDPRTAWAWAALAEQLHVDGEHERAAQIWGGLASRPELAVEATLKAAISHFAAGQADDGERWLEQAGRADVPGPELERVRAQAWWNQGRLVDAVDLMQTLAVSSSGSADTANALAVALWRLRRIDDARRWLQEALHRDEEYSEGLCNRVNMALQLEEALPSDTMSTLGRAASEAPHRYEAHVLSARIHRKEGRAHQAARALERARRRRRWQGTIATGLAPRPAVDCQAEVSVEIYCQRLVASVVYTCEQEPPTRLLLNEGMTLCLAGTTIPDAGPVKQRSMSSRCRVFEVRRDRWHERDGQWKLEVRVEGMPVPPAVRWQGDEIELGAPSGWVPVPEGRTTEWAVVLERPEHQVFIGDVQGQGVDLLMLRTPVERTVGLRDAGSVRILRAGREESLLSAALVAARAHELWASVLATPPPSPPPLVVQGKETTFCYARPGFVRVGAGVIDRPGQLPLLCHEIGHVRWGVQTRFADDATWLCEGLAEFSLHLADDAGLIPGYRTAVLDELDEDDRSLVELQLDPKAAGRLRTKGGFVLSMLRELMSAKRFGELLRQVQALGRVHLVDSYGFAALAGRQHGSALHWFFNQWVYERGGLSFSVYGIRCVGRARAYQLEFTVLCTGSFTPGVPVVVEVTGEGGAEHRQRCSVELAPCRVRLELAFPPTSIRVDPEARFYARPVVTPVVTEPQETR